MKTKLFSFVKNSPNSMVASVKLARWLSDTLKIPLVDNGSISDEKLDILIIVNGAFGFCKWLPQLGNAVEEASRVLWIQQDWTIIPPAPVSGAESPFRLAFRRRRDAGKPDMDWWTTCAATMSSTPLSSYVNWNVLSYDESRSTAVIQRRRSDLSDDVFYYGSYREQRRREFDEYFGSPRARIVVSSPVPKKFSERYPGIECVGVIEGRLSDELARHRLGLYLEDRRSHAEYHSPANRFYEMLSAGLPMVFQPECGTSLRRGGYNPEPFLARPRDLPKLLDRSEEIREKQHEAWRAQARHECNSLGPITHRLWEIYQEHAS